MKTTRVIILAAVALLLTQVVFSQPSGTGWLPQFTDQLGIEIENEPAANLRFTTLHGTVSNPDRMHDMLGDILGGIAGFKRGIDLRYGEAVTITFRENVGWTTTIDGVAVKPAVVQLDIPARHVSVSLVPQKPNNGIIRLKPELLKPQTP